MGTNYYIEVGAICPHCGAGGEKKHIGKSSAGWVFSLHVYPDEGINALKDWLPLLRENPIHDEYGRDITYDDMMDQICNRNRTAKYIPDEHWYIENHAEPGPNNLARHKIDCHCIGHGEGTWDYIIGDFS